MSEDIIKQNKFLKTLGIILTLIALLSSYFSFICYSQINLFYSYIENMDKRFIDSSKKINFLIDENIKTNQKITEISEKTNQKINAGNLKTLGFIKLNSMQDPLEYLC
jgi:predicted PurR-regulated permease PerM